MKPLTKEAFILMLRRMCLPPEGMRYMSAIQVLDNLPIIMAEVKAQMLIEHGINIQDDAPVARELIELFTDNSGLGISIVINALIREEAWRISKKEMNARNIDAIIRKGKLAQVAKTIHSIITKG